MARQPPPAFLIVEFQRCRVPAFARFPCRRGECVARCRCDPTRPASSGGCPPSPRGGGIAALRHRHARFRAWPLLGRSGKRTRSTAPHSILKIRRGLLRPPALSPSARWAGSGIRACQPDRRRGPDLGDRLAKPRYRCAAGPDAVSLPRPPVRTRVPAREMTASMREAAKGVDRRFLPKSYKSLKSWQRIFNAGGKW
jgi:hypothetical protein